ncbi:sporulation integral membrane protein YtvI [Oceanobacillus piezotolerans]|uniref:sporulation integral membrane protein YtvI n=1 Tax=Oceanobacillus piezotolerans TaxID=2448030 RepID=UPI001314EC97|nr:sporulation integral membrane protein YtvI [Oceanobacillus piezotolerans]
MYKGVIIQICRFIVVLCALISGYWLLQITFPYVYPFIIAILLAVIINPMVSFLEGHFHFSRGVSTVIILFFVFVFIGFILYVIILEIYQGILFLAANLPAYYNEFFHFIEIIFKTKILPLYEKIFSLFLSLDVNQQATVKESLDQLMVRLSASGSNLLQDTLTNIPNMLAILPQSFTVIGFITLATFFISADWNTLKKHAETRFPSVAKSCDSVLSTFKEAIWGFAKAQLLLILITGCIIFTGLCLLKVEHALAIAFLSGVADLIPLVGVGLIFVPWIIYLFMAGNYGLTIGITILYMLIIIIRQIIEPKIISSSIGIHPLAALIGYFVGIQVWGVMGLIIAPAILIFIYTLYQSNVFIYIWKFIKG